VKPFTAHVRGDAFSGALVPLGGAPTGDKIDKQMRNRQDVGALVGFGSYLLIVLIGGAGQGICTASNAHDFPRFGHFV